MKTCLQLWKKFSSQDSLSSHFTKRYYLLLLFLFTSTLISAQTFTVKGKVTSSGDSALIGVTVQVKGRPTTTQTDPNGFYTISAAANSVLVFSYLGFAGQDVNVANRNTINVDLTSTSQQLNEVVVVGYGTQKKRAVTGAISSITSDDLIRTPATTVTSALVGKVQGITARSTDSRPGNGTNIQIRNLGNPLYVIDGVPYTGGNTGTNSFGINQGSGLDVFNDIGLDDIESITILKDGSAAIYGLRAANGVVLVTTKKGKNNQAPTIKASGYLGFQNFTRYPKPSDAPTYIRAQLESEQNFGRDPSLLYSKDVFAKWIAGTEKGYKSYNYYDIVMRPNVPQSFINASASGGSQGTTYYFSVSNLKQEAIIKDFKYARTNFQSNLNSKLAKGLQIGINLSGKLENNHAVGVPGLDDYFNPFLSIASMWPTESPYANDNPLYINQTHNVNVNPATYRNDITGHTDDIWRGMDVKLTAQYDLPFGLQAKGTYAYGYQNEDFDCFEYTWNAYIYNSATDTYVTNPGYGNQNPYKERHKRNVVTRFAQFQLNYNKQIGAHSFALTTAFEKNDYQNQYYVVHSVPTNNYVSLQSFSEQDALSDQWTEEARAGYIGRINYSYKQRYLFEALGRYDGSYLYAPDRRWGFFPAVSLGWRISDEPFLQKMIGTNSALSELKIRTSYGETGSESGINAYDFLPGYNFNNGSAIFNGSYVIGLRPRGLPITNLSWVVNKSFNLGVDFGFFNNKLSGTIDVFQRSRSGLPASKYDVLVPSEVGYTLPNENLNNDAHRGIEGIITYKNTAGKVNYSIGANATLSRLRLVSTYKPRYGNSWDYYRNSNEDRWSGATSNFGLHVIGQFQSQEEIDNYKVNNDAQGNRTQLPGDFIYEDANGDGIINALDQRPIGYAQGAQPFMSFGLNTSVGWKGFTISIDFAGATMQTFRRAVELQIPFQNSGSSASYMLSNRWHREDPYDPTSKWIPGTYPAIRNGGLANNNQVNDFWLTNVSYFRLKNMELGYNIPKNLVKKLGISNLRVYVNGTNLFSFDNTKSLEIDPEISSTSGLVYPQQKLVNFGFNLTF